MSKIEIPDHLVGKLGPEMKMDVHWVDVKTSDGTIFKNLVVRGGKYITGNNDDPNGVGEIDFNTRDIADVRRHSWIPFWT